MFGGKNVSRLHPIRTCFFFLTCTRLDASDDISANKISFPQGQSYNKREYYNGS